MFRRLIAALTAFAVLTGPVLAQARPPAQKTGPITIFGTGSTGDASRFSVTPDGALPDNSIGKVISDILATLLNVKVTLDGIVTRVDGRALSLTPQQAVDIAALVGGTVEVHDVVVPLTAAVQTKPRVLIRCVNGGGFQRAGTIIDFSTNTANDAVVRDCTITDGWNGTDAVDFSIALTNTNASNVRIIHNNFKNYRGVAVYFAGTAARWVVDDNDFNRIGGVAVAPTYTTPFDTYGFITNNRMFDVRQHAVLSVRANLVTVEANDILDLSVAGMTVSASGPADNVTFTSVSGPNFATARVGTFLVANGGYEYYITAKNSDTSLTARLSSGTYVPVLTSVPAIMGGGDRINMQSGFNARVRKNKIRGGATAGIIIWDDNTNYNFNAEVVLNHVEYAGNSAICTQANPGKTSQTTIRSNVIRNPGQGKAASAPGWNNAIFLYGAPVRSIVQANSMFDDQPTPTMEWGLSVQGTAPNSVAANDNAAFGAINDGVRGGVYQIVQSSGWGTDSAVSDIVYRDDGITFTITAGSVGIAASPNVAIFPAITRSGQSPRFILQMADNVAGTVTAGFPLTGGYGPISQGLQFSGFTPIAGRAYTFLAKY